MYSCYEKTYYLVDKMHPLPENYVPSDLVLAPIPFLAPPSDPKCLICSCVYYPLKSLYLASKQAGLNLVGISAYRSYARQKEIFNDSVKKRGIEHTRKYIAAPGTSEHQTGLAIDVSCPDNQYELTESFADTSEGIWLKQNAKRFGFIFSYPENSFEKTGYGYEPWHILYACKNARYYGMM